MGFQALGTSRVIEPLKALKTHLDNAVEIARDVGEVDYTSYETERARRAKAVKTAVKAKGAKAKRSKQVAGKKPKGLAPDRRKTPRTQATVVTVEKE